MASSENTPAQDCESVQKQQNDSYDKKCIFCKIVNGEMDTELLHRVSVTEQPYGYLYLFISETSLSITLASKLTQTEVCVFG